MAPPEPMLRLLQGDVGAGKTLVAAAAMLAVESGAQTALLAPTELLARQHYATLCTLLAGLPVRVQILTGRDKGMGREALLADLAAGHLDILIGTHAILQDSVAYADLGLVIIDEQHRFGVEQRLAAAAQGGDPAGCAPISSSRPRWNERPALAFKLNSSKLDELPAPRPWREIFVYAPAVEGVHLRFGRIARGGMRWSDRREDFRTEVLGLVKAQQVKNAVIVPVGAKGGFFPKLMPANPTREQFMETGIAAYKTFINALLDVTDNLERGRQDRAAARCGAPRRGRSLSGGGGRQGHRDLLRYRQRHRRWSAASGWAMLSPRGGSHRL